MPSKYFRWQAPRRQASGGGSDIESGIRAGELAGKLLGSLGGAFQGMQKDAIANKLMNTANAPRAALVSPGFPLGQSNVDPNADLSTDLPQDVSTDIGGTASPDAGMVPNTIGPDVNTAGTSPITGGVAEMKLRQEFQRDQLSSALDQARLSGTGPFAKRAIPLKKGETGGITATGGGSGESGWENAQPEGTPGTGSGSGKSSKPTAYVPGSGAGDEDVEDQMPHVAADFDATFGAKSYGRFSSNVGGMVLNPKTNQYELTKDDAVIMSMKPDEYEYWTDRVNAARLKAGIPAIPKKREGSNQYSTAEPGTEENPMVLDNPLQVRAVPYKTVIKDRKTGKVFTKTTP